MRRSYNLAGALLSIPLITCTILVMFSWRAAAYENTFRKDFVMDAPWRVLDEDTPIPLTIILKDCDTDDIRELHWIRCWDVTGSSSRILWNHDFNDETIGNNATEANFWTYVTTVTEGHGSLANGTLLTPANLGYVAGDVIKLKVTISYRDDILNYTETAYLRVAVGHGAFPWPRDWYGGDLHYHTMYTNNIAEFGAPLPAVQATAAAMGLNWLLTTDHSCDLDETGDGSVSYATTQWEYTLQTPGGSQTYARDNRSYGNTWGALGADTADFSSQIALIRGEEVNLASVGSSSRDKTLHALFVRADYVHSPRSGSIVERPVYPTVPMGMDLLPPGQVVFAAHPSSDLGAELGGYDYAVNGSRWSREDFAAGLERDCFLGIEGFNYRATRYSERVGDCPNIFDCVTNPWPDFDNRKSPSSAYPEELLLEVALWDRLLCENLAVLPKETSNGGVRKVFMAGGSDAHGDFNFSTHLGSSSYATDNAIGKVQTVAYVPGHNPAAGPLSEDALLDALRSGHSIVTDGPFLEIGLDVDADGSWYGAADLQVGDIGTFANSSLDLHMRWKSLPEFGPVTSVKLIAGSERGTECVFELTPSTSLEGYEGSLKLDLGEFLQSGGYYLRAECLTFDDDAGHRAYTNPIWVRFEETPVVVQDFIASPAEDHVQLSWRLSPASLVDLRNVLVQRSDGREGPYATRTEIPLVPAGRMTYLDSRVLQGATYWYRLRLQQHDGGELLAGPVSIVLDQTNTSNHLYTPFVSKDAGVVTIRYRIGSGSANVELAVYDVLGRVICVLRSGPGLRGEHAYYWDRRDRSGELVGRGVYFVRLVVDGMGMTEKCALLKR